MSVLINGMKMPKMCGECPFRLVWCRERLVWCREKLYMINRPDRCPLIELPEKHGRLVDADAMCNDLATVDPQYETMIDWCIRVTEAQPTIIEAEGDEE